MVNELFIDAFCDYLEDYQTLSLLVHSVFTSVHSTLMETRQSLINFTASTFHIPSDSHKQLVDRYLNPLFQEFSLAVFDFNEEYYNKVITKIKERIKNNDWVNSEDLKNFIKCLHRLYLHMILSEPEIELDISKVGKVYKEYIKGAYHCLDGFPKDGAVCVVIIPSPTLEERVYQSIKSSVIIIKNPSKEIMQAVELEKPKANEEVQEVRQNTECDTKVQEKKGEEKVVIEESVKLETTRPASMKYEVIKAKSTHGGNKRNNSLQIKESIRNTSEEPKQELIKEISITQRSKSNIRQSSPEQRDGVNTIRFSNVIKPNALGNGELRKEEQDNKAKIWNFPRNSETKFISQDNESFCNKKTKELNRRLNQMERRCKLQKNIRESLRQNDIRQSSPKRETISYKSINTKNDEIKKSLVKLVSFGKLDAEKNHNMPLQPVKLLAQQEKLMSYQQALKEKMSSLKASSFNGCRFVKKEAKQEAKETKQNYNTIKTLFHASIQEINARIYKYNKAIALNEIGQYRQEEVNNQNKKISDIKPKIEQGWRLGLFNKENKE